MSARLYKKLFTSNGTWVCPAGIRYVILTGCGGGGGGGAGASVNGGSGASGQYLPYFACGGGGGQPALTSTQVVEVFPGSTYTITIGQGGAGGIAIQVPTDIEGGGTSYGRVGNAGTSTVFGSIFFKGAAGGRRGELFVTYPYPGGNANSDMQVREGMFSIGVSLVGTSAANGLSRLTYGGGGGGGGGISNNIYSSGGIGGDGSQGAQGYPYALPGGNGTFGGGGGGGGAGSAYDWNDNGNGNNGGTGGNGFLEIAWMV